MIGGLNCDGECTSDSDTQRHENNRLDWFGIEARGFTSRVVRAILTCRSKR